MMRSLAVLFLLLGVSMLTAQTPKTDDPVKRKPPADKNYDSWVTYKRAASPGMNEWVKTDVPGKLHMVKDNLIWVMPAGKLGALSNGPMKGDTITEEDGTVWLVERKAGDAGAVVTKAPPVKK